MAAKPMEFVSQHIDKFDGTKFHLWKFKMQMVLEDKDLWSIVRAKKWNLLEKEPRKLHYRNFESVPEGQW